MQTDYFGAGFKEHMKQKLETDSDLDESIRAFLELGRLRNELSHNNLATHGLDTTADDVFDLYERAYYFVEVFSDEIHQATEHRIGIGFFHRSGCQTTCHAGAAWHFTVSGEMLCKSFPYNLKSGLRHVYGYWFVQPRSLPSHVGLFWYSIPAQPTNNPAPA